MMRWVALLLVVGNLGFLAFNWPFSGRSTSEQHHQASRADSASSLQLLSEVPADELQELIEEPVTEEPKQRLCRLVGPFEEIITARQLRNRLAAINVAADLRGELVDIDPEFWVHIPPYQSKSEALNALRDLQNRGIDSFLIGSGELENGISLGLFSNRTSAERLNALRQEQGYNSQVNEVPRSKERIWVDLAPESYAGISQEFWDGVAQIAPGASISKKSCEAIASFNVLE